MPESLSSLEAKIAKIDDAIERALLGGQEVTYNGRRVTHEKVEELQKLRDMLQARADRISNGGIKMVRGTPV